MARHYSMILFSDNGRTQAVVFFLLFLSYFHFHGNICVHIQNTDDNEQTQNNTKTKVKNDFKIQKMNLQLKY